MIVDYIFIYLRIVMKVIYVYKYVFYFISYIKLQEKIDFFEYYLNFFNNKILYKYNKII